MRIGFSHNYSKLHGQTSAKLLSVEVVKRDSLDAEYVRYDTDGVFELENEEYLKLLLMGNKGIPFTTLRRNIEQNVEKYCKNVGSEFEVYVKEDPTITRG